jgi:hypothetical protein
MFQRKFRNDPKDFPKRLRAKSEKQDTKLQKDVNSLYINSDLSELTLKYIDNKVDKIAINY